MSTQSGVQRNGWSGMETGPSGRRAWLASPLDMVGPFNLEDLEATGCINFEACMVMSRKRWQQDQIGLRHEAIASRRAAQERLHGEQANFDGPRGCTRRQHDDRQHREALSLPLDGQLKPADIKYAFRKLAQKAHPDVGGSHEAFLRISRARDVLLAGI
jgi:hypothetical protein